MTMRQVTAETVDSGKTKKKRKKNDSGKTGGKNRKRVDIDKTNNLDKKRWSSGATKKKAKREDSREDLIRSNIPTISTFFNSRLNANKEPGVTLLY